VEALGLGDERPGNLTILSLHFLANLLKHNWLSISIETNSQAKGEKACMVNITTNSGKEQTDSQTSGTSAGQGEPILENAESGEPP